MKCPSCKASIAEPVEHCPSCDFELRKGNLKFGPIPRHSRHLTDHLGRLPATEAAKLRGELELFDKIFPQSIFSVFLTQVPHGVRIAEYAFWLANRARFSSIESVGSENFDLLLLIDVLGGKAAFTVGYGLEHFLKESYLETILSEAAPKLREGDLAGGIRLCLERTLQRMREICLRLENENSFENRSRELVPISS